MLLLFFSYTNFAKLRIFIWLCLLMSCFILVTHFEKIMQNEVNEYAITI